MREKPLTLPELASLIGVEYRTLHTWLRRGLLQPSHQASSGTGTPNLFEFEDAVAAHILADLRRAGLSIHFLQHAGETLHAYRDELRNPAIVFVNGDIKLFPDSVSAAAALDRPGVSLVYQTREALDRVRTAVRTE